MTWSWKQTYPENKYKKLQRTIDDNTSCWTGSFIIFLSKHSVLILYTVMVFSESIVLYVNPRFICPFYITVNTLGSISSAFFFFPPPQVLGLKVFQQLLAIRPWLYYPVYVKVISKFCHPAMHIFEKLINQLRVEQLVTHFEELKYAISLPVGEKKNRE